MDSKQMMNIFVVKYLPDNNKVVSCIPLPEIINDLLSTSGIRSLDYKQDILQNSCWVSKLKMTNYRKKVSGPKSYT